MNYERSQGTKDCLEIIRHGEDDELRWLMAFLSDTGD